MFFRWSIVIVAIVLVVVLTHNNNSCFTESKIASSSLYMWSSASDNNGHHPLSFDVTVGVMQNELITQVAAGEGHTVALSKDGKIFAWGDNSYGQLGDQSYMNRRRPTGIALSNRDKNTRFIQVAAGFWHTLALSSNGEVFSWGYNQQGQLGDRSYSNRNFPLVVSFDGQPPSIKVTQVSAGGTHSMALTSDGRVFCWGGDMHGQIGQNSNNGSNFDTPVRVLTDQKFVQISAGSGHSVALTVDGIVLTWGNNEKGQLGRAINSNPLVPSPINSTGELNGSIIAQISAGDSHTVSLTNDGRIFSWGYNNNGQLGNDDLAWRIHGPVQVNMKGAARGKTFAHVSAGLGFSLSITNEGSIYSWGVNNQGQLGYDQTYKTQLSPVAVYTNGDFSGKSALQISAGKDHSVVVATDGKVYSWGSNNAGKLGSGDKIKSRNVPGNVNTKGVLERQIIAQIVASEQHTVILTNNNELYAWGSNGCGQLGDGSNLDSNFVVSVDMSGALLGKTISQIGVGRDFSVALDTNGRVYTWGCNYVGQLGVGTLRDSLNPILVSMDDGVIIKSVAVGMYHTVVLASNGKLYSWGANSEGQLGDRTTEKRHSPAPIRFASAVITQIVAGAWHTIALTIDGACYGWGSNTHGELITESTENLLYPRLMNTGNARVTMIGASKSRTVILTNDGVVHIRGGEVSRHTQHRELVNDEITQLVTGSFYTVAVTNDSRVFAWGEDFYNVNLTNVDSDQSISQAYVTSIGNCGILGVTCESGYFGLSCESFYCHNVTHSSNNVCSGNGNCVALNTCECREGYSGDDCTIPICFGYSSSSHTVCSSKGKCIATNKCVCRPGYYGDTCSINLDLLALLSLLIIPLVILLVVLVLLASFITRRVKRDKKIESDLRACLLEEMSDFETTNDMALFIDMKDIKLINRISEGAAGVVFKGKWKTNWVAVKKMKVPDDESFLKEISVLQSLRHPNILYLYGYSSNDAGDKFLITEYAAKGSLDKVLYAKDSLRDFNKKIHILCQIADTMSYLHDRNPRIVHRDLKPQNVLIDENGNVRICDFGLSKTVNAAFTTGVSYGTIEYSAPELLTRNGHDEKCDIYSFGIMMHELFVVEHPYSRGQDALSIFSLGIEIVNNGLRPSIPFTVSKSVIHSLDMPDEDTVKEFFARGNNSCTNSAKSLTALVRAYYTLATRCWDTNPARRPSFEDIATTLCQLRLSL